MRSYLSCLSVVLVIAVVLVGGCAAPARPAAVAPGDLPPGAFLTNADPFGPDAPPAFRSDAPTTTLEAGLARAGHGIKVPPATAEHPMIKVVASGDPGGSFGLAVGYGPDIRFTAAPGASFSATGEPGLTTTPTVAFTDGRTRSAELRTVGKTPVVVSKHGYQRLKDGEYWQMPASVAWKVGRVEYRISSDRLSPDQLIAFVGPLIP